MEVPEDNISDNYSGYEVKQQQVKVERDDDLDELDDLF